MAGRFEQHYYPLALMLPSKMKICSHCRWFQFYFLCICNHKALLHQGYNLLSWSFPKEADIPQGWGAILPEMLHLLVNAAVVDKQIMQQKGAVVCVNCGSGMEGLPRRQKWQAKASTLEAKWQPFIWVMPVNGLEEGGAACQNTLVTYCRVVCKTCS